MGSEEPGMPFRKQFVESKRKYIKLHFARKNETFISNKMVPVDATHYESYRLMRCVVKLEFHGSTNISLKLIEAEWRIYASVN